VPALYAEHGGGGGDPRAVDDYVEGCLNVAAHLGIIDRARPADCVRYVVEDDRDRAGHLQIQHPAAATGFFRPCVELGQVVRQGEPLGQITDLLGDQPTPVPAGEDGLVLFLRDVPSVLKGDTLGGLLPICEPGEVCYER
jgi:predicted deacylase